MKTDSDWWVCSCGKRLLVSKDQMLLAPIQCPHCGKRMTPSDAEDVQLSTSETQMINIQDMARMAQEGVEIGLSGEWDTSFGPATDDDKT